MDSSSISENYSNIDQSLDAPSIDTARNRLAINILSNVFFIGVQALFTLWLTPYLINFLGIAAYGVIPLTQNIVSYTSVLTIALSTTVTRYITIELEQRNVQSANQTFNTSVFAILGLFALLIPFIGVLTISFVNIFDIPMGWEKDAQWLFILTAITFFLSILGSIFSVSAYAYSEFLKYNLINFAGLIFRIVCIVLLFFLFAPRLWYAGAGTLLAALISLIGYMVLWRKLTPELKIQISAFSRKNLRNQLGMGGWVIVNSLGSMLMFRVDLIVINTYYGAAMTGAYASITLFTLLMEYLVSAATNVIRPVILMKYAQNDIIGLTKITKQTVKLSGFALAIPVGLLCGFAQPTLALWLGPEYKDFSLLMIAILIHQALNYSVRPMFYVHQAYNKVRWPGIATVVSGIFCIILAVGLATWNPFGAIGVALAVGIAWTAKNGIFTPLYTAYIMQQPWWAFFPSLFPSILGTLAVGGIAYALYMVLPPFSWLTLFLLSSMVAIIYVIGVWFIGLNKEDHATIFELIPVLRRVKVLGSSNI